MNRVCFVGRLCTDPEIKYTQTGTAVTTFRLAVDRGRKDAEGKREADFFNIVCWKHTAEFVAQYLDKGRLISFEGRAHARTYRAADDTTRHIVEFVADNIQGLDKPRPRPEPEAEAAPPPDEQPEDESLTQDPFASE